MVISDMLSAFLRIVDKCPSKAFHSVQGKSNLGIYSFKLEIYKI